MSKLKFLADSMLGTLARKLRLVGFDTAYNRDADDRELRYLARSQDRILLTRDLDLAGKLGDGAWAVSGNGVREEFLSIAPKLASLSGGIAPFSRCLECGEPLIEVDVSEIEGKVPPYILSSKRRFSRCSPCGKVFWEGTHSERMGEEVSWMQEALEKEKRGKGEKR